METNGIRSEEYIFIISVGMRFELKSDLLTVLKMIVIMKLSIVS